MINVSESMDEFFRKLEKKLREIEEDFKKDVEKLLRELRPEETSPARIKGVGEVVEPLYTVRDLGDRLVVYVDLPYASEGTIDIKFEGRKMLISAGLKKTLNLRDWSERYEGVEVKQYKTVIDLPFEPDPKKTKIRVKKGVAEVTIFKS